MIVRAPVKADDLGIRYADLPDGVRGYVMIADEGATMAVRIAEDDRDAAEAAGLEDLSWDL